MAAKSDSKVAIVLPTPKPGKGQVVFFRPGGMGGAIKCTVRENGKMVGARRRNRYYVIDAEPGVHTFTAKSEATDAVTVQVEPDETSFVKCKIAMGMMVGRPNLSPATELTLPATQGRADGRGQDCRRNRQGPSPRPRAAGAANRRIGLWGDDLASSGAVSGGRRPS